MKSGKCPKCGSGDIYVGHSKNFMGVSLVGNYILLNQSSGFRGKFAKLNHYACASCNYIEAYVADNESMQNIKEEWKPMNPKEKRKRKNDEG